MNTFQTLFLVGFTLLVLPKIPWRQMRCLFLAWRGGDRAEEEDFAGWKPNPARGPLLARIYVAQLESRIQSFELAYRMQLEAAEAFDISREPKYIRDQYGPGTQARQILITRRLLERGVPSFRRRRA